MMGRSRRDHSIRYPMANKARYTPVMPLVLIGRMVYPIERDHGLEGASPEL